MDDLELNGSLEWADVEKSRTGFGVGARYYFINRFSVGGRAEFSDSDTTLTAGVRLEL